MYARISVPRMTSFGRGNRAHIELDASIWMTPEKDMGGNEATAKCTRTVEHCVKNTQYTDQKAEHSDEACKVQVPVESSGNIAQSHAESCVTR